MGGETPLHFAADRGDVVDVNAYFNWERKCDVCDIEVVKLLLHYGAYNVDYEAQRRARGSPIASVLRRVSRYVLL